MLELKDHDTLQNPFITRHTCIAKANESKKRKEKERGYVEQHHAQRILYQFLFHFSLIFLRSPG